MVRNELNRLGYVGQLIQDDYVFDDASTAGTRELRAPVATFAQWPPSYRNACIGVLLANGQAGPQHVAGYSALGAPLFFEISGDRADRFQITASGKAVFLESVPAPHLRRAFELNRRNWNPDAIFRAKAITPLTGAVQLEFVDIGLLPALKGMIHGKLDRLLKEILVEAIKTYKSHTAGHSPDKTSLFHLIFRCLAAKIFKDRGHSGNWAASDASAIIREIQQFYGFNGFDSGRILDEPNTQQIIWDKFRRAFNFQNISVDDLAFIYENTLIQEETRKQFGVHSTPPAIAELMVDRLPFHSLPQDERYVLEPCAGHGVFLIAALRRLRELLPATWSNQEKHTYLKDRLTAIEMDTFAAEVCRLSLTLADYPNPNGWKILSEDIFATDVLDRQMNRGRIVLCNPPFEDFTQEERGRYGKRVLSVHKPYEVLRKVLADPPAMFGFVLPKSAILGDRYGDLQDQIDHLYTNVETIALPDRIFAFSDQETVLVLVSERNDSARADVITRTFWIRDNDRLPLIEKGRLPGEVSRVVSRTTSKKPLRIWNPPLADLWDYLEGYPKLKDVAEIHRGIQWNISLQKYRDVLISNDEKLGFHKGLDKAHRKLEPYYARGLVYLNMGQQYQLTTAQNFPWNKPKVITNSRRLSRGPWRIVGYPDFDGLACYKNFIGLWPRSGMKIESISAIINSPLLNAALFTKGYGRDNSLDILGQIPVPIPDAIDNVRIIELVNHYCASRNELEKGTNREAVVLECIDTLMKIDAMVLKAYDLPPKLERKLLEFFRGYKRPLPFEFPDYYPEDFKPYVPLYKFIELDLKQASAGELLKRITPLDSEEVHDLVLTLEQR
jgi:hypothetical protein